MKTKLILILVSALLTTALGIMSHFLKASISDNRRKDKNILAYQEKVKTYYVENVGLVTEKSTLEITVKELKKSKDSIHEKFSEITHELKIKERNIEALNYTLSEVNMSFEAETEMLSGAEASILLDSVIIDSVEYEEYNDEWTKLERVKLSGASSSDYTIKMDVPVAAIVHRYKSDYKEYKFVRRWIKKLFEKRKTKITGTSDNPHVTISNISYTELVD